MGRCGLLIFTKCPESIYAKTRLRGKGYEDYKIQELHRAFIHDALHLKHLFDFTLVSCDCMCKELCLGEQQVVVRRQVGDSFGKRIDNAISDMREMWGNGFILIGTDCPYVTKETLLRARELVIEGKPVIGMSSKGGFYLLGLPADYKDIQLWDCFNGDNEAQAVIDRLGAEYMCYLDSRQDIDEISDLEELIKHCVIEAKPVGIYTKKTVISLFVK